MDEFTTHPEPDQFLSHSNGVLACPRCGTIDVPLLRPGAGPHALRALCGHCHAFVQWISVHTPAERAARRDVARQAAMEHYPPSEAQLIYLQALGDIGQPPTTMAEASKRIDALRRGEAQP